MKECNNWFIIAFELEGQRIEHQIDIHSLMFFKGEPLGHWHYYFWVHDLLIDVFGSVDADGNIRTSGDIGDGGECSAFGIDVYKDSRHTMNRYRENCIYEIDDVDFVACDLEDDEDENS